MADYTLYFDKHDDLRFFIGTPGDLSRASVPKSVELESFLISGEKDVESVLDISMNKDEEVIMHLASRMQPSWKMDFGTDDDGNPVPAITTNAANGVFSVPEHDTKKRTWVAIKLLKGDKGKQYKFNLHIKNIVDGIGTERMETKIIIDPVIKNDG